MMNNSSIYWFELTMMLYLKMRGLRRTMSVSVRRMVLLKWSLTNVDILRRTYNIVSQRLMVSVLNAIVCVMMLQLLTLLVLFRQNMRKNSISLWNWTRRLGEDKTFLKVDRSLIVAENITVFRLSSKFQQTFLWLFIKNGWKYRRNEHIADST